MRALAAFICRGSRQAIIATILLSMAPLVGTILAAASIGLVTLRYGAKRGAMVLLWSSLPFVIVLPLLAQLLQVSLLTWVIAIVLRNTLSLRSAVLTTTGIGLMAVLLIHLIVPDITKAWLGWLQQPLMEQLFQEMNLDWGKEGKQRILQSVAQVATGLYGAGIVLVTCISLMLARSWQAKLINPGGFKKEFLVLSITGRTNLVLFVVLIAAMLNSHLARDMLPILFVPFMLVGLAIIHALANHSKKPSQLLIGFYFVSILIIQLMPMVLVAVAVADTKFNFRQKLAQPNKLE